MEQVKDYGNKDFYGLNYEDFCKKLEFGINISEEKIEGQIEWALMFLNFKDSPIRAYEGMNEFSMKKFDGVNLFCDRVGGDKLFFLKPYEFDLTPSLFDYNIDYKYLNFKEFPFISSMKSLSPIEKRGICLPQEHAIRESIAFATTDEKWYTSSQNYKLCTILETPRRNESLNALKDFGVTKHSPLVITEGKDKGTYDYYQVMKMLFPKKYISPIADSQGFVIKESDKIKYMSHNGYQEDLERFWTGLSVMLTYHYEWQMYIKESDKSIGFKIPINPSGFSDVFSLKNLPSGESRRKSIIHFVKEHTRRSPANNQDNSILVRKYLRGETKFQWNGLIVELIPSKSDIINTKSKKKFLEI